MFALGLTVCLKLVHQLLRPKKGCKVSNVSIPIASDIDADGVGRVIDYQVLGNAAIRPSLLTVRARERLKKNS